MANAAPQKVIVQVAETEERRIVILRDVWSDTLLEKGMEFKSLILTHP